MDVLRVPSRREYLLTVLSPYGMFRINSDIFLGLLVFPYFNKKENTNLKSYSVIHGMVKGLFGYSYFIYM